MKVLIINASCGNGSTGRIVADLYHMLRNKGHFCKIAFGHGEPRMVPYEDTIRVNNKWGYYIHNVLGKLFDRAGFFSRQKTKKFVKIIEEYKPDLIHLHNLHGFWINIDILFKELRKLNIPIVWTLHDCWAYTGHCSHYTTNKCYKWVDGCHACQHLDAYPESFFVDNSRNNYLKKKDLFTSVDKMTIVTPSKWLAGEVKKSFLGKYPVIPIPNGIDLETFSHKDFVSRKKFGIPEHKKVLLAVSFVWNKEKGLDDLIELSKKIDKDKYVMVIVGLSAKQIETLLLPSTIIAIERTSNIDDLVELYSLSDVFLNPSYQETMGMVTAEAIACGTPVIVYDKTAVPEIVDPQSGFVVEAGDITAMKEKIEKALDLNKESISKCAMKFEKNNQYEKYYTIYKSIMKQ